MKALIIGAAGFVGGHLIEHLLINKQWSVYATKMNDEIINSLEVEIYNMDILDVESIKAILTEVRPDYIFHLAAQSSVALSWENPGITVDVNIKGSINVLEAVRCLKYTPRVMLIGSGEEYGNINPEENPVSEETRLRPGNIYAATKVAQQMIGEIFSKAYEMNVIYVRAFNHIGPNQGPAFVVADFCKQTAEIEKGLMPPVLKVGNLSARRDFTDVRDIVRAYTMLMEKGVPGEIYNVGSGEAVSIQSILEMILSNSSKKIEILIDQGKFRPLEIPEIQADISKLQKHTGWARRIELEETIMDTLEYWRKRY